MKKIKLTFYVQRTSVSLKAFQSYLHIRRYVASFMFLDSQMLFQEEGNTTWYQTSEVELTK